VNGRDPVVDTVRAIAVVGVVVGHWLVTATVAGVDGVGIDSPLRLLPGLVPLTWVLQTLGLFFFVGGFAAARSEVPLLSKVRRVVVPVLLLLGFWVVVLGGLWFRGLPQVTLLAVVHLVTTPLWFIGVYLLLSALMPVFRLLDRVLGVTAVALPVLLVVLLDVPAVNVVAVWWAAWQLGTAAARVGLRRSWGVVLVLVGAVGFGLLVRYGGYPASAVGVPGQRSNLAPPSLAALALAFAQIGVVLLVRPVFLPRLVAWINGRALPIFLVHQSALLVVTLVGSVFGPLPGLLTEPDGVGWLGRRLLWLPVFGLVAWVLLRDRRQQRQADRGDVQDHADGVRLQDEQRGDAGRGGKEPRPPAVARARAGRVQQVPAQQEVDEVLQRIHLEDDQRRAGAREAGNDEPEHAERAERHPERGGQAGAVGLR
jgi:hypothetical protein